MIIDNWKWNEIEKKKYLGFEWFVVLEHMEQFRVVNLEQHAGDLT